LKKRIKSSCSCLFFNEKERKRLKTIEEAKRVLRGSIAPIITPFKEDESVDYETLQSLINWHIESGSHGISVTGTTGEPSSLTLSEREKVMETAIQTGKGHLPVVPGTGSTNHQETLHLTKLAQEWVLMPLWSSSHTTTSPHSMRFTSILKRLPTA
jgi:hypothetical protein